MAASALEDDAKQLFKDLQDAQKAGEKKKLDSIRLDFDGKFAATEFVKTHKKEIDDLAGPSKLAVQDAPKPVESPKVSEKKPDPIASDETSARELLKKAGWTEITGNWIWKRDRQAFFIEGQGEWSIRRWRATSASRTRWIIPPRRCEF